MRCFVLLVTLVSWC